MLSENLFGCLRVALAILFVFALLLAFLSGVMKVDFVSLFSGGPGAGGGPGGGAGSSAESTGPLPSYVASFDGGGFSLSPSAGPSTEPAATPSASGNAIPSIGSRVFTSGSAQVTVSGFFGVDTERPINAVVSYATNYDTWLYYGDAGTQAANVGIALGASDPRVEISLGAYRATPEGDECSMQVDVTGTSISGHISCPGVDSLYLVDGSKGLVDIEIDFTANS